MSKRNPFDKARDAYLKAEGLEDNAIARAAYLAGFFDGDDNGSKRTLRVLLEFDRQGANDDKVKHD